MRIFSNVLGLKSKSALIAMAIFSPAILLCTLLMVVVFYPTLYAEFKAEVSNQAFFYVLLTTVSLSLIASLYMLSRYRHGQISKAFVDQLPFPAIVTTRKGEIRFQNETFMDIFPEAQNHIKQVLPYFPTMAMRDAFEDFMGTTWEQKSGEKRFVIFGDGDVRQHYRVTFKHHGSYVFWVFAEDTKSRIHDAESDFQRALEFTYLFNSTPSANIILDESGVIQGMNETFKSQFLKHENAFVGKAFVDLLAPSCAKDLSYDIVSQLKTREPGGAIDLEFAWGDNVIAYVSPLSFDDGVEDYNGFYLQIFDNSEQRNIQLRLAHSQKLQALGQLAGGIAHDFNNLLTAMIGFCDLLLMRMSPGDQSFTDIMQIKQNANRATNLIRQLLAFSRQQTLQPTVLDVSEVLSDLSVLLQRLIGSSVELKIAHDRSVDFIRVDRSQFEQVIINLVVNAKDAIIGDGTIKIATSIVDFDEPTMIDHETIPAGSYIQIEVMDDGQGISRKNLERVFDPFFSTKAVGEGTGLGLATAYGTVKQTGGHISVDSTVGVGTKFTILLPRYIQDVQKNTESKDNADRQNAGASGRYRDLTGSGSILIAEDEDAVRLFACRALKDKGYTVEQACHGQEALDMLRRRHENGEPAPDLLITDVVMPKMDGPTLVKEAELLYPNLKVMYISGYAEDAFRDMVNLEEKIRFLAKPFSLKVLAARVKETISTDTPPGGNEVEVELHSEGTEAILDNADQSNVSDMPSDDSKMKLVTPST